VNPPQQELEERMANRYKTNCGFEKDEFEQKNTIVDTNTQH
jgi:hypothetical protein